MVGKGDLCSKAEISSLSTFYHFSLVTSTSEWVTILAVISSKPQHILSYKPLAALFSITWLFNQMCQVQLLSCSPSFWSPYAPNTITHGHCLVGHQRALFAEHCGIFLSLTQDLGPRTLSMVLSQSRLGQLSFAFKLFSVCAFFFVRWSTCKTPHAPVLLQLSQVIALQGKEQTKLQFIPSLDHWFPNIFLIYHDLGECLLTAILITFVLLPALPLTEEALLLSLTVYQMLFYKTCCVSVVACALGLGIFCDARLACCLLNLMGRIWFPKLGFHSCGLTDFLSVHTEVSTQQQLNTHFIPQTSQLEQLLQLEVVLLTSLANW